MNCCPTHLVWAKLNSDGNNRSRLNTLAMERRCNHKGEVVRKRMSPCVDDVRDCIPVLESGAPLLYHLNTRRDLPCTSMTVTVAKS
jgi:hypothetical protein